MKLTNIDRQILKSYESVVEGISQYLGPAYEVVLHSLEDYSHAAIRVFNGQYSGRKEGAPITDIALECLSRINESGNPFMNLIYSNTSRTGAPMKSATFPIVGERERVIGLICINFHTDIPLNVYTDNLFAFRNNAVVDETFAADTEELIRASLDKAKSIVYNDVSIPFSLKNREIIAYLDRRNLFQLKDAVQKVADLMGISKNTVYLHLRNLNNGKAEEEE